MKIKLHRSVAGQAIVMVVILLAILGGGYWWLLHSKKTSEQEAHDFAEMAASRLARQFDPKFLDQYLGQDAQLRFPPSFRSRLIIWLRELGVASEDIDVQGTVTYTSQFFQPVGQFRAHLKYPTRAADLDLTVSSPKGWWQIDSIALTYEPTPTPAPTPVAIVPPVAGSPVPSPTPAP